MSRLSGLALLLWSFALPSVADPRLGWFDLDHVSGEIAESLASVRELACGLPTLDALPFSIPADSRLVFVACHGGPHRCAARAGVDGARPLRFACPANATVREIASLHLVSPEPLDALEARLGAELGDGFERIAGTLDGQVAFVEKEWGPGRNPWSPKRLHVTATATRGDLTGGGFRSQLRVMLSLWPPSRSHPASICDAASGILPAYDRDPASELSRYRTKPPWCYRGVGRQEQSLRTDR